MRFCLVSSQENWGGGEALLVSIADELRRAGHSVSWILRSNSRMAERIAASPQPILFQFSKRGQNWHDIVQAYRSIRDWSPDVVIMNDTHAVVLAGLATLHMHPRRRPLRLAYKHTVFPLRSRFKYRLLTDKIICVSQAAKQVLVEGGMPEQDAVVVYGGVVPVESVPFGSRSEQPFQQERRRLGIDQVQRPLLLAVGSLLACKGHADLLHAIALLPEGERPAVAIAGEGEERKNLTRLIGQLGLASHVQLLGYRSDVHELMAAADLIVHPSTAEGLSLVLIEAQMMHKPIVATAVGGAQEVLGQVASAGGSDVLWVAQAADPSDLSACIQNALQRLESGSPSELCEQLERSAARALEMFSVHRCSTRLVEAAAEMLALPSRDLRRRSAA